MKFVYDLDKNKINFEMTEKETIQLFKQTKNSLKSIVKLGNWYDEHETEIKIKENK